MKKYYNTLHKRFKTTCLLLALISGNLVMAQNHTYEWSTSFTGPQYPFVFSVCNDDAGNVYTTGGFQGTIDFDPGSGTTSLTSLGSSDIYVAKQDAGGNLIWVKSFAGTGNNNGRGITVDAAGNIYVTGGFSGTVDFDPGSGVTNISGAIFTLKLNASGDFVWARGFGPASGASSGEGITLDDAGNVYTVGKFSGTVDFDPGAGTNNVTANGNTDACVIKLNAAGDFLWVKTFGSTGFNYANGVALDASGGIYTTGGFQGTVDFDPGAGVESLTSSGNFDVFISKLDASGNYVWAKKVGASGTDISYTICQDDFGNLYTSGVFNSTVDFDPGSGTTTMSATGVFDGFVLKLGCSVDSSTSIAGNTITANATGVTYQWINCSTGSILTGETNASYTATLNGEFAVIVSSGGCMDTSDCVRISTANVTDVANEKDAYQLFPNPATSQVTISNFQSSINTISISSITGKVIRSFVPETATIDVSTLPQGIYFIQIQDGDKTSSQKLIKH